uniref:PRK09717 superfamily protein n=1 Tax=Proteus mirabilis TaxID=584 RepID=K9MQ28_PROMI|nr:PRK09717 superfamily protein [Proteus mirabilis]AFW18054.1 PRK09717 superfamily protein [Proteus mirabilis]
MKGCGEVFCKRPSSYFATLLPLVSSLVECADSAIRILRFFVNIDEVAKWRPFTDQDGNIWDLSFLDAHEVSYTHCSPGKPDIVYKFTVSYSFHCFCKDYPEQTEEEKLSLMYDAGKD